MMNTETAKKMAMHRQAVMEDFLEEFMEEWEGEKWYVGSEILWYSRWFTIEICSNYFTEQWQMGILQT